MGYSIKFNSPVVLIVSFVSVGILLLKMIGLPMNVLFGLEPDLTWSNVPKMFTYVLAHANYAHLVGNLSMFLLLGPALEAKYGSKKYLFMIGFTAISTALLHVMLFDYRLIGLSGIVFMNIILISISNVTEKEIPLTFILVSIIFIGQEVYNSFGLDHVSQFAHIFGGALGGFLGFSKIFQNSSVKNPNLNTVNTCDDGEEDGLI